MIVIGNLPSKCELAAFGVSAVNSDVGFVLSGELMDGESREDNFRADGINWSEASPTLGIQRNHSPIGFGFWLVGLEHFWICLFRVVSHMGGLKSNNNTRSCRPVPRSDVLWLFGVVVVLKVLQSLRV